MNHDPTSAEFFWSDFIESMVDMVCSRLDSISGNLDRIATQLETDAIESTGELESKRWPEEENSDG